MLPVVRSKLPPHCLLGQAGGGYGVTDDRDGRFRHGPVRDAGRSSSPVVYLLALMLLCLVCGCGTMEGGRGWGQDALWPVNLDRVGRAAHDAFFHPGTLVPLAGAAVFAIDDFDERTSDWAVKHNPIFGSEDNAGDASDALRDVLRVEVLATALATPSGDTSSQWLIAKLRGLAVELGAVGATGALTSWGKDATGRERPDESDDRSFPSGHASTSASYATLANRNLEYIEPLEDIRPVLAAANTALVLGTGWARVEARRHFPSDVLAGVALGHFVTAFIHDAFMNLPEDGSVELATFVLEDGAGLALSFRF